MSEAPDWILKGRAQWEYRGQKRPDFAIAPEPDEESVWDYPRPPRLEKDHRTIIVKLGSYTLAKTTNAYRILETASPPTFYIPQEDVRMQFLKKASGNSLCEWKGNAAYWDIITPEQTLEKASWSYPDPFKEFETIAGYLSFYPSRLDCYIDNEQVLPQPGGFYGGWITSEIIGPVKGEIPEASL